MPQRYGCDRCGAGFGSNRELQEHRMQAHGPTIQKALRSAGRTIRSIFRM